MLRFFIIIAFLTIVSGCHLTQKPSVPSSPREAIKYDPASFRSELARLVAARNYRAAVVLVKAADVERQLSADGRGYTAIGGINIYLPSIPSTIEYDPARDWYMPGTSDSPEDAQWQAVAVKFAKRYNVARGNVVK